METDLRLPADGYMVVMHDATLVRTTTCRGWVARRTRLFIQNRCRLDDGSRVPFAKTLLNLILEIKPDAQDWWTKRRFRGAEQHHLPTRGSIRATLIDSQHRRTRHR